MINKIKFTEFEDNYFTNFSGNDYEPVFYSNSQDDFLSYIIDSNESPSNINLFFNKFEEDKSLKGENEFFIRQKPISLDEEKDLKFANSDYSQNDIDKSIDLKSVLKKQGPEESKCQKKVLTSTYFSTDKNSKIRIKKLLFLSEKNPKFNLPKNNDTVDPTLPSYFRIDMAKKHFKVRISQFATDTINKLIKESDIYEVIKDTIHLPNSLLFTSKVTENANIQFLNYTIREIFIIGKDSEELQRKNFLTISRIYEIFKKYEKLPENLQKIKNFLEMRYEDLIKMFYDSAEFNIFKNEQKTKFFDDGTKAQEGFSLLENYGLIKLFKMLKKKRKRD